MSDHARAAVKHASRLIIALAFSNAHRATLYLSPTLVVRATQKLFRHGGFDKRKLEVIVTAGRPNYRERAFIKVATKAGERFPVRKVQLQFPPKKSK